MRSIASQKRSMLPTGLVLPEAISVPPDLTKPMSRRPRHITSAVAYSSATRTGSFRTVTSVPRLRIRTRRVCLASTPRISGLAPKRQLIPAWCSLETTLIPMSSHSRYSSSASSKRSAATRGSQYRLGRLARTESASSSTCCGTNGYGFSFRYQACIRSLLQEGHDALGERLGLLDLRMVARPVDQLEARPGDGCGVGPAIVWRHDPVAGAPQHERGHGDPGQPPAQVRVVHIWMPAVETEGFPVPVAQDKVFVGHGIEVGRPAVGVVPAPSHHLARRCVEDVQDVRRLPIADLDAEGIDQDEPVQAMAARHRDLGGQPSAERQPQQRDLPPGQLIEEVEVEVHEIVDRVEIVRPG